MPGEGISEKATVTVTDNPEPKTCPECNEKSLFKMNKNHWACTNCDTQFLIQKEIQ